MAGRMRSNECPGRQSSAVCSKYLPFLLIGFVLTLVVLCSAYFWITNQNSIEKCKEGLSEEVTGSIHEDGILYLRDGRLYGPDEFQVVNGVNRACVCKRKPCVRKCCGKNEILKGKGCTAVKDSPFKPGALNVYNGTKDKPVNVLAEYFHILYGDVCQNDKYLLNETGDENYLMLDGTVLYLDKFMDPTQYCLDSFTNDDHIYTLLCFPTEKKEHEFTVYPIGMIISIPFLFITFLVYAIVPDLRNLHGKSLMCHAFSLVIAYSFLSVIQLGKDAVNLSCCITFAFIIQFSFLASFFWLNVMCFDIWWVFSGLRPLRGTMKEREFKKFIMYSVYAWGCPFVIFIISVVMQFGNISDDFIKPNFGIDRCWFKDSSANILYFYLPIGILVFLNVIMFVTTAYRLEIHKKEQEKVLRGEESKRHDDNDRQRYNLYLKLFIVMGINWAMELVSFFVKGQKYLWIVTDMGNTLQGVFIFLIFVWKRRILRLLTHRLCPKLQLFPATSTTSRSKVSPSRTTTTNVNKISSIYSDGVYLKKVSASDESDAPT